MFFFVIHNIHYGEPCLLLNGWVDFQVFVFSGLHIVYTRDEVDIVQNLIFYIESAYKVAVSSVYYCSVTEGIVTACENVKKVIFIF